MRKGWSSVCALFVGYDDATARLTVPLIRLFGRVGGVVHVAASGLASRRYAETFELDSRFHFIDPEAVSSLWCQELVNKLRPNMVVVGFSSPRGPTHFESLLARSASDKGASVVAIEDVPGAALARHFNAGGGHPIHLFHAASPASAESLRHHIPGITELFPIEIGGILSIPNHAFSVDVEVRRDVEQLRNQCAMVVCFGDHGEIAFEEQVALLKSCGNNFGVAYTLNPKKEHRHEGWRALLAQSFGARAVSFQGRISGDALASLCDLTAVGGGSMIDGAIYNGKPAVILNTPRTIEARLKGVGSPTLDVMDLEIVPSITVGCNLWKVPATDFEKARNVRPPYDPTAVFQNIRLYYEEGVI